MHAHIRREHANGPVPEIQRVGEEPNLPKNGMGHGPRNDCVPGGQNNDAECNEREDNEASSIHPAMAVLNEEECRCKRYQSEDSGEERSSSRWSEVPGEERSERSDEQGEHSRIGAVVTARRIPIAQEECHEPNAHDGCDRSDANEELSTP